MSWENWGVSIYGVFGVAMVCSYEPRRIKIQGGEGGLPRLAEKHRVILQLGFMM